MKIMKNLKFIIPFFLIGVVDQIDDDLAVVELTNDEHENINTVLPVEIFPCDIEEGEMFYFLYADGVTEIRCGEPPE